MLRGTLVIIALVLVEFLSGCDNGNSGFVNSQPEIGPFMAWPRIRRTDGNLGLSLSPLNRNEGVVTLLHKFVDEVCVEGQCEAICEEDNDCDSEGKTCVEGQCEVGCDQDDACDSEGDICRSDRCVTVCSTDDDCDRVTATGANPILGRSGSIYLGTNEGLLALDIDGKQRWLASQCVRNDEVIGIEPIESPPTISLNGRDIVFTSNRVFRLREPERGDDPPECLLAFDTPARSAPLISFDGFDLSFLSTIIGSTDGRLLSISNTQQIRWAFPTIQAFDSEVSSPPALIPGGIALVAPNGELYSLDATGAVRWNSRIGAAYTGDRPIPAPVSLENIYTVSSDGDLVAFSTAGTRVWDFTPESPIVGSVTTSVLSTDGGIFFGGNVVFAVDEGGTLYGLTANDGELVRFCQSTNRACLASSCPAAAPCGLRLCSATEDTKQCRTDNDCLDDEGFCETRAICSGTSFVDKTLCESDDDCVGVGGETCGLFCGDRSTVECTRDTCLGDPDAGLCRRLARHPVSTGSDIEIRPDTILSADSFVVATTTDGRICARRIDGSVPNGRCARSCTTDADCGDDIVCGSDGLCEETGASCLPDSCAGEDRCCESDDDTCSAIGACGGDPLQACIHDTCADGETCRTPWQDGCIDLGTELGTAPLSSPIMDGGGNLFVATGAGLVVVE